MLALNAKDPKEKEEINYLISKQGQKAFKAFLAETPTFFDLLQKWPSAKLSLGKHHLHFGHDVFCHLHQNICCCLFLHLCNLIPAFTEHILEFVPTVRPRLYSIASAPDVDGDNLQLCIIFDDWTTPSGRYRHGLCTGYLKELVCSDNSCLLNLT